MSKTKFLLAAVLASCAALSFAQAPAAGADGGKREEWREHHPRRAEVNSRLANQNRRIHHEVKEGEMTKGQAAQLHAEDRSIRRQELFLNQSHGAVERGPGHHLGMHMLFPP